MVPAGTVTASAMGHGNLGRGIAESTFHHFCGSSATLGGATFYGNVLANQSITINASTFIGRALASVAGVSIPLAGGSLITNPGGN